MKVVTLSTKDSFGGAARVAFRLAEEINKSGIEDLLLVNNKRTSSPIVRLASDFHDHMNFFTGKIERLVRYVREERRLKEWFSYTEREDRIFSDIQISLLKNALTKIPFDLIHMHWVGESFVNFTEFKQVKYPIVWTIHDCFPFTGICSYFETCDKYKTQCDTCPQLRSTKEKDLSYKTFNMKMKRYSSLQFHIVSPSRWLAQSAQESALLQKFPITVIPNGIDTKLFYPMDKTEAKKLLSLDPDKKTILFGGISAIADPRKGGDLLAESLSMLSKEYPKDSIELLIFGAESGSAINFDYPTKYLGYVDAEADLNIAYNAADLAIMPSKYENFPNTILESLSSGTAVVAFNIGGNPDMIDHKVNGYLAQAYDTVDLMNGIKFCLDNNQDNKMGEAARKKVINNFTIEEIAQKYIRLYEDILAGKK